jgi:transcriptional regulator GlxA family with amidase domain
MKTMKTIGRGLLLLSLATGCASAPRDHDHTHAPARVAPTLDPAAKNVGILVFDDLFITEFVAPFDIYKHAGKKLNVFSVSPRPGPIRTYEGVVFEADFHFGDAPKIDVLVVPSGNGSLTTDLQDPALLAFVRERAAAAEWVTSHCWGAFTLGAAGLLDGREATTFPTSVADLGARFPALQAQAGPRFVVSGNVVTSSGGLAAFEASLFVIERLFGTETADSIAAGLVFAPENLTLARTPREQEPAPR